MAFSQQLADGQSAVAGNCSECAAARESIYVVYGGPQISIDDRAAKPQRRRDVRACEGGGRADASTSLADIYRLYYPLFSGLVWAQRGREPSREGAMSRRPSRE